MHKANGTSVTEGKFLSYSFAFSWHIHLFFFKHPFNSPHTLYQAYSDKLNLQCNIAITAVFLFPDTSIYPTLECCTAEPANSDGPGTAGAIKSDISNGKVNSVFQMHFLEDGGSRGFRHWKWQRLAPSLCLWNALMNFPLFPVITNK